MTLSKCSEKKRKKEKHHQEYCIQQNYLLERKQAKSLSSAIKPEGVCQIQIHLEIIA